MPTGRWPPDPQGMPAFDDEQRRRGCTISALPQQYAAQFVTRGDAGSSRPSPPPCKPLRFWEIDCARSVERILISAMPVVNYRTGSLMNASTGGPQPAQRFRHPAVRCADPVRGPRLPRRCSVYGRRTTGCCSAPSPDRNARRSPLPMRAALTCNGAIGLIMRCARKTPP